MNKIFKLLYDSEEATTVAEYTITLLLITVSVVAILSTFSARTTYVISNACTMIPT